MSAGRCNVCGAPTQLERVPPAERTVGAVAGLLEPGFVGRCAQHGHQPLLEVAETATALAHERIPRARRCRLRHTCCAACRTVLSLPARRGRRSLTVEAPAVGVHTIHLDLPLTRCPDCGLDQLSWQAREDLDELLQALYDPGTAA